MDKTISFDKDPQIPNQSENKDSLSKSLATINKTSIKNSSDNQNNIDSSNK